MAKNKKAIKKRASNVKGPLLPTSVTTVEQTPVGAVGNTDTKAAANAMSGTFSLQTLNGVIYEQVREELKGANGKKLYKEMMLDSAIAAPMDLIRMVVGSAEWEFKHPSNASAEEKKRAKQLNYMKATMVRPWSEYITEAISFIPYGFWTGEKVMSRDMYTPHGNIKFGLKDICTISQDTIHEWHFKKGTGENIGLVQDYSWINNDAEDNKPLRQNVPRKKYIHLRNLAERNNPEGKSVLDSVYMVWKYKCILEEYLEIGAIKDLSGIPVFKVQASKLQEAFQDPSSEEAKMVENLNKMIQGLHAGELNGGVIPVDYDENSNPLYDFKLMGIEGAGKQYDILEIIKHYNMQITIRFFSDILTIGSNGSGSHALSDNKMSLVRIACTHYLKTIKDTFNHDIIPQLYKINGWEYDPSSSCQLRHSSIEEFSLDNLGNFIQKCVAVEALRPSDNLENMLLDQLNLDPYTKDTVIREPVKDTKHAEGLKSGMPNGTGKSTGSKGNANTGKVQE